MTHRQGHQTIHFETVFPAEPTFDDLRQVQTDSGHPVDFHGDPYNMRIDPVSGGFRARWQCSPRPE